MLKWLSNEIVYSIKTLKAIFTNKSSSNLKRDIFKNLDRIHKEDNFNQNKMEKLLNKNLNVNLTEEIKILNTSKDDFPIILDIPFSKYLTKFINSPRDKDNPNVNINNLLFVTGPERTGKSTFIRQCLKEFIKRDTEYKNFAIHFDCRKFKNFEVFLFAFEEELINSIHLRNFIANKENLILLTEEKLMNLLFFRYEKGWIEICLYKELLIIKEGNSIFKFDDIEVLNGMLFKYQSKKYKELPLLDNIKNILNHITFKSDFVDCISNNNINNSDYIGKDIKKLLYLIKRILIKRESFNKECIEYRNGLNVMEYLLDVINYISGYHESQNIINEIGFNPMETDLEVEDSTLNENNILEENEKSNHSNKNKNINEINPNINHSLKKKNYDFKKHRVQSVLVLESIDNIDNFVDCENRGKDWLRHLILRLYVRVNIFRIIMDIEIISL